MHRLVAFPDQRRSHGNCQPADRPAISRCKKTAILGAKPQRSSTGGELAEDDSAALNRGDNLKLFETRARLRNPAVNAVSRNSARRGLSRVIRPMRLSSSCGKSPLRPELSPLRPAALSRPRVDLGCHRPNYRSRRIRSGTSYPWSSLVQSSFKHKISRPRMSAHYQPEGEGTRPHIPSTRTW